MSKLCNSKDLGKLSSSENSKINFYTQVVYLSKDVSLRLSCIVCLCLIYLSNNTLRVVYKVLTYYYYFKA